MPARKQFRAFDNPEVKEVFDAYPTPVRETLLRLRHLIFDEAASNEGVGELEETLKWGQPSYLTSKSKSGSTIRIDQLKNSESGCALYFHCQTNLVSTMRDLYPDSFEFEKNRALVLKVEEKLPESALRHCISMALTYHLGKKQAHR